MKKFIRPNIAEMKPYTPIRPFEVLSKELGREPSEIVKLDANENPYGAAPSAVKMMHSAEFLHIYPDPEANVLREILSDYLGIPKGRIIAGLGADELIDLVFRVVLSPDDIVVDSPPSFGMYPFSTYVNAGTYLPIFRDEQFNVDIAGIEQAVADNPNVKIVCACSPNNPNGSMLTEEEVKRLLALDVVVVLDEAYIEFAEASGDWKSRMHWVMEYDNLVVLRTFSKLAGLAGLRIGYGGFPEWMVEPIMKIKQPYNVHVAADLAARGALQDTAWLQDKVEKLVAERNRMVAELAQFEWLQPYPSTANFVLFRVIGRDASELKQQLAQEGILVRYFANKGVDNCIRISAGRPDQTDSLIEALKKLA